MLAVRSALVEGRQKREVAAQRDIATNQATLARDANERAQRTLGELSDTLSQIELQQVAQLLEPDSFGRNDVGLAVAHLARSLRQNPADFRAAYRLLALFMQRDFARPVSEHRYNGAILSAAWVGPRLLLAVADTNQAPDGGSAVTLFDHSSGRPLQGPLLDGAGLEACGLSPSGRHFWAARNQPGTTRRRIVVGAVATGRAAGPEFVVGAAPRRVVFDIEEGRLLIQLSDSRASPAQCRIEVFDIPSGQMLGRPSELPDIAQDMVTFDATGRRSILPSNRGAASIGLLDIETGKVEPLSLDTFAGAKAQIENERALRRGEAGQLGSVLATQPGPPTDAPVIVPLPWRQDLRRVFSPDGLLLAVIDEKSYQVQVWSLGPTRAQAQPLPHPAAGSPLPYGSLRAVEMDPDGRRLVGTFSTNQGGVIEMNHVVVWDPRRAQVVTTFCPWGDGIQHVCLSPDAERVLVLSKGRARLFSAVDGHLRGQVWGVSTNDGWLLAGGTFSPDGGRVLVWSPAGEGVVRRVDSFTPVGGFGPHGGTETESGGTAVMAARMSPAGDRVATY
ncbi:MAG TPA: hypothetical protein PKE47_11025, partial [Verrucomicrobiota bacterium]|nr:hypothetical protein [Verrucomicrobiota bacterium]